MLVQPGWIPGVPGCSSSLFPVPAPGQLCQTRVGPGQRGMASAGTAGPSFQLRPWQPCLGWALRDRQGPHPELLSCGSRDSTWQGWGSRDPVVAARAGAGCAFCCSSSLAFLSFGLESLSVSESFNNNDYINNNDYNNNNILGHIQIRTQLVAGGSLVG